MSVKVKALEWVKYDPRDFGGHVETVVGRYHVWTHHEAHGQWFWRLSPYGPTDTVSGVVASEAAAKAIAQADYEARILSALVIEE